MEQPIEQPIEQTIKYSSYTEAQKKATNKYRVANKDKINETRKAYYKKRKENDKEFIEYKRTKAREYYHKKKQIAEHAKQNAKLECEEQERKDLMDAINKAEAERVAKEAEEKIEADKKLPGQLFKKVVKSRKASQKKSL